MFAKYFLISFVLAAVAAKDDIGSKFVYRIYEDCSRTDFVPCLKKKAILFFDRAARMDSIPLMDGIDVIKTSNADNNPVSENEIEAQLPRNLADKDEALTEMLWNKVASFANSRTIQLSLPKMTGEELNKGVEEGRGKMKKMMGTMMMGAAMKMAAMIPLAIAGLFVLAGKALITAKIALLLAGIMAIKKLMSQKGSGGGGHDSHGWSSGGTGGYDRRAYDLDLPYAAFKRE